MWSRPELTSLGLLGEAGNDKMSVTEVLFSVLSSNTVTQALAELWPETVLTRQVYRPLSPVAQSVKETNYHPTPDTR